MQGSQSRYSACKIAPHTCGIGIGQCLQHSLDGLRFETRHLLQAGGAGQAAVVSVQGAGMSQTFHNIFLFCPHFVICINLKALCGSIQ